MTTYFSRCGECKKRRKVTVTDKVDDKGNKTKEFKFECGHESTDKIYEDNVSFEKTLSDLYDQREGEGSREEDRREEAETVQE